MVADVLTARLGGVWTVRALGASNFCETWRADGAGGALFVKSAPLARAAVLHAEADGLAALAAPRCIRVPAVIGCWDDVQAAVLALEWLHFTQNEPRDFGARFGRAL